MVTLALLFFSSAVSFWVGALLMRDPVLALRMFFAAGLFGFLGVVSLLVWRVTSG